MAERRGFSARLVVAGMLCEMGNGRGVQSQIAAKLHVHRSTVSRCIAALRRSGWDAMGLDRRRTWIEEAWATRNDERAREHRRWVENGGPQAAKRRQQLYREGLIQRRHTQVEPVQAPVYRPHWDEHRRFRNNRPSDAPLAAPVRTGCSGRPRCRSHETLEEKQRRANNYVAQNIERLVASLLGVSGELTRPMQPTLDGSCPQLSETALLPTF